jgi:hypothetical protein
VREKEREKYEDETGNEIRSGRRNIPCGDVQQCTCLNLSHFDLIKKFTEPSMR